MLKIAATSVVLVSLMWGGGNIKPVAVQKETKRYDCRMQKVYVDRETGLMWQDAPYTVAEETAYHRNRSLGKVGTHAYAVRYCANLDYAGYNDWRLPSIDELSSRHHEPGEQFVNTRDGDFWTATGVERGRFYVVYPADAYRYKRPASKSYYIRCVRCAKESE